MTERRALLTNRDFYRFVTRLGEASARTVSDRTLEDYLKTLWRLGRDERAAPELPLTRFAELLEEALRGDVPEFDPAWAHGEPVGDDGVSGYARWEQTVLMQIVDLHEMDAAGTLADDDRELGIDAPRGGRWYNFDPLTFLECAVAGTFAGCNPEETAVEIGRVSWDTFVAFLASGQGYE